MLEINPQYTFDNTGKPVGVFLPIEDWNTISKELELDLPEWQKQLIDSRLQAIETDTDRLRPIEELYDELG